jgi:hypothetical protein
MERKTTTDNLLKERVKLAAMHSWHLECMAKMGYKAQEDRERHQRRVREDEDKRNRQRVKAQRLLDMANAPSKCFFSHCLTSFFRCCLDVMYALSESSVQRLERGHPPAQYGSPPEDLAMTATSDWQQLTAPGNEYEVEEVEDIDEEDLTMANLRIS